MTQLGDSPDVSEVLWGLWTFHTLSAELETRAALRRNFYDLPSDCLIRDSRCAVTGRWRSPTRISVISSSALDHFEKALALYDPAHIVTILFFMR